MENLKFDRFTITAWKEPIPRKLDMLTFMIWQTELTEEKKVHWQTYVEFKKKYTWQQVKNIFKDKDMHVKISNKDRSTNMFYILKPETYYGSRYMYNDGIIHRYKGTQAFITEGTTPITSDDEEEDPREVTGSISWEDIFKKYPDMTIKVI